MILKRLPFRISAEISCKIGAVWCVCCQRYGWASKLRVLAGLSGLWSGGGLSWSGVQAERPDASSAGLRRYLVHFVALRDHIGGSLLQGLLPERSAPCTTPNASLSWRRRILPSSIGLFQTWRNWRKISNTRWKKWRKRNGKRKSKNELFQKNPSERSKMKQHW